MHGGALFAPRACSVAVHKRGGEEAGKKVAPIYQTPTYGFYRYAIFTLPLHSSGSAGGGGGGGGGCKRQKLGNHVHRDVTSVYTTILR